MYTPDGSWKVISKDKLMDFLTHAVTYQTKTLAERFPGRKPEFITIEEAYDKLLSTGKIKWSDSWYCEVGVRRVKETKKEKPEYSRTLDCGHTVHSPYDIMQTSYSGTACPDCYDYIESQGYSYKRH
jgi:hypothetical protein